LEKIRHTNGPNPSSLPVDDKKRVSVTSSVGKPSKNHIRGPICGVTIVTRTTTTWLIAEQFPILNSRKRLALRAKLNLGRSLWPSCFLFEEINALKRQLKPVKTVSSKKRKSESILSTEINVTTSSDEGEKKEYLFTSSNSFRSNKTNLTKSSHPTTNH
jgi:hypothetical protein